MAEYIEREALLKTDFMYEFVDPIDVDIVKDIIENEPSADVVEVRHGRWEVVIGTRNSPKWGNNRVACSECRRSGYTRYSYCPNCGAKMDGGNGDG